MLDWPSNNSVCTAYEILETFTRLGARVYGVNSFMLYLRLKGSLEEIQMTRTKAPAHNQWPDTFLLKFEKFRLVQALPCLTTLRTP